MSAPRPAAASALACTASTTTAAHCTTTANWCSAPYRAARRAIITTSRLISIMRSTWSTTAAWRFSSGTARRQTATTARPASKGIITSTAETGNGLHAAILGITTGLPPPGKATRRGRSTRTLFSRAKPGWSRWTIKSAMCILPEASSPATVTLSRVMRYTRSIR
ncbi:hypothetical protein D3C85_1285080 [compost metagenome]